MIITLLRFVCLLVLLRPIYPACIAVEGDRLHPSDLHGSIPALQSLEPAADLGPAPAVGAVRIVDRRQISSWLGARAHDPASLPASVCLTRTGSTLAAPDVLAALRRAVAELFPGEQAMIELLDFPRQPLPAGTLRFTRSGVLGGPVARPDAAMLWRGVLLTPELRSVPVWARVKVLLPRVCWLVSTYLPAGSRFQPERFAREERWINPLLPAAACAAPAPGDWTFRRSIAAGQPLRQGDLGPAPAVRRGETVSATLDIGSAVLSFPAVAERDGRPGDVLPIRNPATGKRLQGRVESGGQVRVSSEEEQEK